MTALSAADLASMRDDLELLLPDTCVIQTLTNVQNSEGGFTETWAASGTVACRLDNLSGQISNVGDALQVFSGFRLTVPWDTSIAELVNRVVHGGYDYNVISVDYDKSWPISLRAHLERV